MIKVLFFGYIANRLGQHESEVRLDSPMTVQDLIQNLACEDFKPLIVAVNQEQVLDWGVVLQDGDEVALMPPFSGG